MIQKDHSTAMNDELKPVKWFVFSCEEVVQPSVRGVCFVPCLGYLHVHNLPIGPSSS